MQFAINESNSLEFRLATCMKTRSITWRTIALTVRRLFVCVCGQGDHCLPTFSRTEPRKFCDFRRLKGLQLKTFDTVSKQVQSLSECREMCVSSPDCRSFNYDSFGQVCRRSHLSESSTIHINEPYSTLEDETTYEVSTCYNGNLMVNSSIVLHGCLLFGSTIFFAHPFPMFNPCSVHRV